MKTFRVRITWGSGEVDVLHMKATDGATALAEGINLALAYAEASGKALSAYDRPCLVEG